MRYEMSEAQAYAVCELIAYAALHPSERSHLYDEVARLSASLFDRPVTIDEFED